MGKRGKWPFLLDFFDCCSRKKLKIQKRAKRRNQQNFFEGTHSLDHTVNIRDEEIGAGSPRFGLELKEKIFSFAGTEKKNIKDKIEEKKVEKSKRELPETIIHESNLKRKNRNFFCEQNVQKIEKQIKKNNYNIITVNNRCIIAKFTRTTIRKNNKLFKKGVHNIKKKFENFNIGGNDKNNLMKYFKKRYLLWERYDSGNEMGYDGWFSVTPVPVAKYLAFRLSYPRIMDAFAGVGGNTIQFALNKKTENVIAVELNGARCAMVKHNTQVYGVADKVEAVNQNFLEINEDDFQVDCVFMSPPWGGIDYTTQKYYSLFTQIQPSITDSLVKAGHLADKVVIMLPRNIETRELVVLFSSIIEKNEHIKDKFAPILEIEQQYFGKGSYIANMVYFGVQQNLNSDDIINLILDLSLSELEMEFYIKQEYENEIYDILKKIEILHLSKVLVHVYENFDICKKKLKIGCLFLKTLYRVLPETEGKLRERVMNIEKELASFKLIVGYKSNRVCNFEEESESSGLDPSSEVEKKELYVIPEVSKEDEERDEQEYRLTTRDNQGDNSQRNKQDFGSLGKRKPKKRSRKHKQKKNQRYKLNKAKRNLLEKLTSNES